MNIELIFTINDIIFFIIQLISIINKINFFIINNIVFMLKYLKRLISFQNDVVRH